MIFNLILLIHNTHYKQRQYFNSNIFKNIVERLLKMTTKNINKMSSPNSLHSPYNDSSKSKNPVSAYESLQNRSIQIKERLRKNQSYLLSMTETIEKLEEMRTKSYNEIFLSSIFM